MFTLVGLNFRRTTIQLLCGGFVLLYTLEVPKNPLWESHWIRDWVFLSTSFVLLWIVRHPVLTVVELYILLFSIDIYGHLWVSGLDSQRNCCRATVYLCCIPVSCLLHLPPLWIPWRGVTTTSSAGAEELSLCLLICLTTSHATRFVSEREKYVTSTRRERCGTEKSRRYC